MSLPDRSIGASYLHRLWFCAASPTADSLVYIIDSGAFMKIGSVGGNDGTIESKIAHVQAYNPIGIVGMKLMHGGSDHERELHEMFSAHRLTLPSIRNQHGFQETEWFAAHQNLRRIYESMKRTEICRWCKKGPWQRGLL